MVGLLMVKKIMSLNSLDDRLKIATYLRLDGIVAMKFIESGVDEDNRSVAEDIILEYKSQISKKKKKIFFSKVKTHP